jgi:nucleoside-diphosphate-sugar epimerase
MRTTSHTRWVPAEVERHYAALRDPMALGDAVRGASVVFHLAAVTSSARESDYTRVNVEGTRNVLEAVRLHAPGARVVLCSSLSALGPARGHPLREDDQPQPISAYGRSKLAAERVAEEFAREHGLDIVIVRPTAVYGPRDRDILAAFRLARNGLALRVGPAEQSLTMLHVRDLAKALMCAARAQRPAGRYHVSDGMTYMWREVIDAIGDAVGRRPLTLPVPPPIARAAAAGQMALSLVRHTKPLLTIDRIGELAAADWSCDTSRARNELGFAPGVSLVEGMRETASWYRSEGWLN